MTFRKPAPLSLFFLIATTITLLLFGSWQVERLRWKESLIDTIKTAQAEEPLDKLPANAEEANYRSIDVFGRYLHDVRFYMIAAPRAGRPGYFLTTPFKLDSGQVLLVNRGWSPRGDESLPQGIVRLRGVIRPLREKRYFSPANDEGKNLWFYEDIAAMGRLSGQTLLPYAVEATGNYQANVFPIPNDGKISLRNDHLGYAITWFALAAIGIIMFAVYHRQPPSTSPKE